MLFVCAMVYGQDKKKYTIYAGISHCNINREIDGHINSVLYPAAGPNYTNMINFGVNRVMLDRGRLRMDMGLGLLGIGANNFVHQVWSYDTILQERHYFITMPVNLSYSLLNNKQVDVFAGLSPMYNIYREPYPDGPGPDDFYYTDTHRDFLLNYQLGVRVGLTDVIGLQVQFSQSFFSFERVRTINQPWIIVFRPHSFDFSVSYKF